ncbi:hypothetical protein EhV156_00296 [Emiliania huxleyi virus 156]|nr:hypothetical protein EhV156_00296 [Emiliania huxleyi virus 156]
MPQLNATTSIGTEPVDSTESTTPSQFPKGMVSAMVRPTQLDDFDTTNFFGEKDEDSPMVNSPAVPEMDDWDDDEMLAAMESPPGSPVRSPSPVIDDDDDEETQALWAANTQSQEQAQPTEESSPPAEESSPPAEEPAPPVDETPTEAPVETPPPPPTTTGTPFSFAAALSDLTADITTNDQCSEIIKIATHLIASTRAHGKTLTSAIKKQTTASTTRVDGAPRQRAPKGSRPPTAAGIYNVEKRAAATEAYNNGRRAVKQPKTDNKASHIQNILAEMWRDETAESKAHYKAFASERAAAMVSV